MENKKKSAAQTDKQKKIRERRNQRMAARMGTSGGSGSRAAKAGGAGKTGGSGKTSSAGRTSGTGKTGGNGKTSGTGRRTANSEKQKQQALRNQAQLIGFGIIALQEIASIVFVGFLLALNMLPTKYLALISMVLLIFALLVLLSQIKAKKMGITGKVISVLLSAVLTFGAYYIGKTNSVVNNISGGDTKVDKVVVAVLKDNPAEKIEDAADYSFGVQYAMKGDEIRETVAEINEKLGTEIAEAQYEGLSEQAEALKDGEVDAIIYNDAYTSLLEETVEGYSDSVKIIYTHKIESKIENIAIDIEVKEEPFVVYISGIDVYGAIETNSRSDVNILAVVNPNTHQVLLVTTPRDYYVPIPEISGGMRDKLTHAGIYGVDRSMATLGELYDTDIQFYARVNFTSLVQMVDALGGIDVYSEFAFTTHPDTELVMDVQQGLNHFNGEQALAFSRERQNLAGGDYQRGKNQQAVITAMIQKAISPAILMGANELMESVSGNVDTNMSAEQIQSLIKDQLANGGEWNITSVAAEGSGDSQYCYSYSGSPLSVSWPVEESVNAIKAQIAAVKNGETLQ